MHIQPIQKWIGTTSMFVSAVLVSVSVTLAANPWAFIGFLLGHLLWAVVAIRTRDLPLIVLNTGFIFVDVYAIGIRL